MEISSFEACKFITNVAWNVRIKMLNNRLKYAVIHGNWLQPVLSFKNCPFKSVKLIKVISVESGNFKKPITRPTFA